MTFHEWVKANQHKGPDLVELAGVMEHDGNAWGSVADLKGALRAIADDKALKAQDKTRMSMNLVDIWEDFKKEPGPTFGRKIWRTFITENPAIAATSAFALILLFVIIWAIWDEDFLKNLGNPEIARGLITFFFALGTVGVAIILTTAAFSINADDREEMKERFDMGKQVLTALIGIFGTILGFYFGSLDKDSDPNPPKPPEVERLEGGANDPPPDS